MTDALAQQQQLEAVLKTLQLPPAIQLRCWTEDDLPTIQHLSDLQGWPTHNEPAEVLAGWHNSWPALVATKDERVIGYVRGLTDKNIIMQITDLLVDPKERRQGIGRLLLDACHLLYPRALVTLTAENVAIPFYKSLGFQYGGETYLKSYRLRL